MLSETDLILVDNRADNDMAYLKSGPYQYDIMPFVNGITCWETYVELVINL